VADKFAWSEFEQHEVLAPKGRSTGKCGVTRDPAIIGERPYTGRGP